MCSGLVLLYPKISVPYLWESAFICGNKGSYLNMLWQVLHEVEAAQGPLDLNELSRRLGVSRGTLDGMIQFWVRKGRLVNDLVVDDSVCAVGDCPGCGGPQGCPFTMKMPQTYSLKLHMPD